MHIEVFSDQAKREGVPTKWFWHFKNRGRITADAESFPSKSNALRAAKAVVIAVAKEMRQVPHFSGSEKSGITKVTWF